MRELRNLMMPTFHSAQFKINYIPIWKNASSSFLKAINHQKIGGWKSGVNTDWRYIVILRDPVDRFISATNMYFTQYQIIGQNNEIDINIKNDTLFTNDGHYIPQWNIIKFLPKAQIDFFYYGYNVIEDISTYYSFNFNIDRENVSKHLFTKVDENYVRKLYRADCKLIDSVEFKNGKPK